MVQATLGAVALTVIAMPVLAAIPSCEQIKKQASAYSIAQVRERMESMRLPKKHREYVENCLKGKR